jgi:hypothetical protein
MPQTGIVTQRATDQSATSDGMLTGERMVGFMLAHEQFTVPQLVKLGDRRLAH